MLQKSPVDVCSEQKFPFFTGEFSTIPGVNFRISEEIKRFHNPLPRSKIRAWTKTAAWEIMACTERWTKRCRTPEKGPFFFWDLLVYPPGKPNIAMENPPFLNEFPIGKREMSMAAMWDFPECCWWFVYGFGIPWENPPFLHHHLPIGSMYGIFPYIYHKFMPNVGKYPIHGSYGLGNIFWNFFPSKHRSSADPKFGMFHFTLGVWWDYLSGAP